MKHKNEYENVSLELLQKIYESFLAALNLAMRKINNNPGDSELRDIRDFLIKEVEEINSAFDTIRGYNNVK